MSTRIVPFNTYDLQEEVYVNKKLLTTKQFKHVSPFLPSFYLMLLPDQEK